MRRTVILWKKGYIIIFYLVKGKKNPCSFSAPWFPALPSTFNFKREFIMSQHNSFKASAAAGTSKRTVLKRFERLDLLKKRGQWKGQRLSGLPKTKPDV